MLKKLGQKLLRATKRTPPIFDRYVSSAPTWQNAVDAVPGWNTCFPPQYGVRAGDMALYCDPRLAWAIERFGSLEGREVLELGPLEGSHTFMLERAGARTDAVEANRLAFLRCLVAKEILGLTRSKFWLGDFVKWLETTDKTYDFIVASGVLYHMTDPLRLIELIAAHCPAVYFWTHVICEEDMPATDPRRLLFSTKADEQHFRDLRVKTYQRTYLNAATNASFCGGMRDDHRWLDREDFFAALKAVGFKNIQTAYNDPAHHFGPSLSIFASK